MGIFYKRIFCFFDIQNIEEFYIGLLNLWYQCFFKEKNVLEYNS